jgi:hypothetical protein
MACHAPAMHFAKRMQHSSIIAGAAAGKNIVLSDRLRQDGFASMNG